LKVLPQRLAETPGLRQRLEREAKAISSLNHPHICTLYDIGREGEVDYLVMEFLEGDTLAQRLKRGALSEVPSGSAEISWRPPPQAQPLCAACRTSLIAMRDTANARAISPGACARSQPRP
jgi:hypothetical protein